MPFFIRAGKCLPVTATEVLATLRRPPQHVFDEIGAAAAQLPALPARPRRVAIALGARAKATPATAWPGDDVELFVCNSQAGEMTAYERLLGDAMGGDPTLFARQDSVEEAWRIVDDLLAQVRAQPMPYEPGSWGPAAAERMTRAVGGWVDPGSLGRDACG